MGFKPKNSENKALKGSHVKFSLVVHRERRVLMRLRTPVELHQYTRLATVVHCIFDTPVH